MHDLKYKLLCCEMGKISVNNEILMENVSKEKRWDQRNFYMNLLQKDGLHRRTNGNESADINNTYFTHIVALRITRSN